MYCSAQYFGIPYGDSGSASTSSWDGIGASRPYRAPPEDANSTRAPATRAASSTLTVPTTLTCASAAGAATEERTSICAARWHISSGRSEQHAGARDPGRLQHVDRPDHIDLRVRRRRGHRGADIDLRGQVAYQLWPDLADDRGERPRVRDAQLVQRRVVVEAPSPA